MLGKNNNWEQLGLHGVSSSDISKYLFNAYFCDKRLQFVKYIRGGNGINASGKYKRIQSVRKMRFINYRSKLQLGLACDWSAVALERGCC